MKLLTLLKIYYSEKILNTTHFLLHFLGPISVMEQVIAIFSTEE